MQITRLIIRGKKLRSEQNEDKHLQIMPRTPVLQRALLTAYSLADSSRTPTASQGNYVPKALLDINDDQ